jgi:hypothetical protein
VNLTTQSC